MDKHNFFIDFLSRVYNYTLDTIAPQDPLVRKIERMTPEEFIFTARPFKGNNLPKHVICFFSYQDPLVKTALLEVKSYGNKKIANLIGAVLYELLIFELSELEIFYNFNSPVVVPIPMTRKSVRKRGWNQCALFLDALHNIQTDRSIEIRHDILIKIKETDDQVGKSRSERFKNLSGCFGVKNKDFIQKRNVLILDDIVTTGATLQEASKTLKNAGAKKTLCVAIAH